MTFLHPLWPDVPTAQQLQTGWELVGQARERGDKTARERAYIEATAAYYTDAPNRAESARLASFAEGWRKVYEQFPTDPEGALFFALAHMATAPAADTTYQTQKEAGAIAERVLADIPDHPGAHHYIIHAYDFPTLGESALEVARKYGKVAPDVSHATHMPTHIFIRLGLWQESIAWNERAKAAGRRQGEQAGAVSLHYLHALDYLAYAYLQTGQEQQAKDIRDSMLAQQGPFADVNPDAMGYHLTAAPARYALERHEWEEAARLPVRQPASFPWGERFGRYEANTYAARALGRARTGELEAARQDLAMSEQLLPGEGQTALVVYWAGETALLQTAVKAWLTYTEGAQEKALVQLRAAAEREAKQGGGAPSEFIPVTELLGEMLMEMEQYAEALGAYEAVLVRRPNRLNSLVGAGRAAELAGHESTAARHYQRAVSMVTDAQGETERLQSARAFLATNPKP